MKVQRILLPLTSMMFGCLSSMACANEISSTTTQISVDDNVLKTFRLYHNLGPNATFIPRGIITLSLPDDDGKKSGGNDKDNGQVVATFQDDDDDDDDDDNETKKNCFEEDYVSHTLDSLVQSNGYYKVKILDVEKMAEEEQDLKVDDSFTTSIINSDTIGTAVMRSVSACDARRSGFREKIHLNLNHVGGIVSLSYDPVISPLVPKTCTTTTMNKFPKELRFRTLVTYSVATPGVAIPLVIPQTKPPPGFNWIKRVPKTKKKENRGGGGGYKEGRNADDNDEDGRKDDDDDDDDDDETTYDPNQDPDKPENASFLKRYWYIILPLSILTFFGGEEEQPPSSQKQQPGKATTQQLPSSSKGSVSTGSNGGGGGGSGKRSTTSSRSSGNTTRRGKRG